jgi:predicted acylesterase/phospholipase RssA/CRP-like cAMP-binding protein
VSASGGYARVAARAEELRDVLVTSRLFGGAAWEDDVLADVVPELEEVVVRSGELVVRESDPSDDLFVVVGGRLRVVHASADGEEVVDAEIGRGETVGELGLITGDRRSATVYAVRDSLLARLARDGYESLCRRHPLAMMQRFAGGELRRLTGEAQGARRHRSEFRGAIALFAADGVQLRPFADELARRLASHGEVLAVTAAVCDRVLGRDGGSAGTLRGEEEATLARWLAAQELEHRFLLYEADLRPSAWAARCLRQSDHVVVLAGAGAAPQDDRPVPVLGDETRRRTSLVLLHADGAIEPGAAAAWAGRLGADDVHHVRDGTADDVARLARLLSGGGTALVVGGGGARSFAAAGVARAIVEAGTPIDAVCGVSGGAIVAALVAMGLDYDELIARCTAAARRIDYTLPVYALTTGRNWSASLEELFGDTRIEDLLLPYSCTSVNLTAAELVVHDRGSLLHAVRASTAIPGILTPVWDDGDLLVDGGLMNNLPIDLAHDRPGVGRVLAVDVTPPADRRPRAPFGYSVSGWRALAARIARRPGPGLPTATSLLMQSMLVADARVKHANAGLAAWIFHPPLLGHSLMEWDRIAAVAEAGYRFAVDALRDPAAQAAVVGEAR